LNVQHELEGFWLIRQSYLLLTVLSCNFGKWQAIRECRITYLTNNSLL